MQEYPTQEMADPAPPQDESMSDEELAEMFRFLEASKGRVNPHDAERGDQQRAP